MSKFHLYCCCVVCRKELTAQNLDEHHNKHSKPAVTKNALFAKGITQSQELFVLNLVLPNIQTQLENHVDPAPKRAPL